MEEHHLPQESFAHLAITAAMRRPLNDLLAHIRALVAEEGMLTPFQRQHLQQILQNSYRLLRTAESLSLSENYTLYDTAVSVFSLWPELERCLESARLLLTLKERTLQYDLPSGIAMIRGDMQALSMAVLHLVANALDASPAEEPVLVRGSLAGDQLLITVIDRGCGIAPERQSAVFEPYHALTADGVPYQSLGLGIPLARRIAEAHGGSLRLLSREGGTEAILSLPLLPDDTASELRTSLPKYLEDLYSPLYTVLCEYIEAPWPCQKD